MIHALGARSFGVAIDDQGMVPESLEAALAEHERLGSLSRVKAIYVTSYFDNPSTVTLSAPRAPQSSRSPNAGRAAAGQST